MTEAFSSNPVFNYSLFKCYFSFSQVSEREHEDTRLCPEARLLVP